MIFTIEKEEEKPRVRLYLRKADDGGVHLYGECNGDTSLLMKFKSGCVEKVGSSLTGVERDIEGKIIEVANL